MLGAEVVTDKMLCKLRCSRYRRANLWRKFCSLPL